MKTAFRIFVVLVIATIIIVVIRAIRNANNSSGSFEDAFVKWLLKKAGGKSSDPDDDDAGPPAPGTDIHTNKDVTWTTFNRLAAPLGYSATVENFLAMPMDIWSKIMWNRFYPLGAAYSNNKVLAVYMSQWFWGGWDTALVSNTEVRDILISPISNEDKLAALVRLRKVYFDKVVARNPAKQKYLKGWKKKADEFYSNFKKYL